MTEVKRRVIDKAQRMPANIAPPAPPEPTPILIIPISKYEKGERPRTQIAAPPRAIPIARAPVAERIDPLDSSRNNAKIAHAMRAGATPGGAEGEALKRQQQRKSDVQDKRNSTALVK